MEKVTSLPDALEHVSDCTDHCNGVFEFAIVKNGKRFFREAESIGLLESRECVELDDDGAAKVPERWSTGYKLTDAGRACLLSREKFDAEWLRKSLLRLEQERV